MNTERANTEQKRWVPFFPVLLPSRSSAACDGPAPDGDESCERVMQQEKPESFLSFRDPISGLTHCLGVVLALIGLIFLIHEAIEPFKPWHLLAYSIFGIGSILAYTASTLYHWIPASEERIRYFRKLDHIMIFVLIAATATPLCLVPLKGIWAVIVLTLIWGSTAGGVVWKLYGLESPQWVTTTVYVLMSWMLFLTMWPSLDIIPPWALIWLLIGGFFYTLGAAIDMFEWPNPWPKLFGFHEIFHILAVLGTLSHFWMLYKYFISLG